MKLDSIWRRVAALFAIGAATLLAGCNTPPAFQVSQPSARDGTVEAMERPGHGFCVAIQWHPEKGTDLALFQGLVAAARDHLAARG